LNRVPLASVDYMCRTRVCLQQMYLEDVLTVQLSLLQAVEKIWFYLSIEGNGEERQH